MVSNLAGGGVQEQMGRGFLFVFFLPTIFKRVYPPRVKPGATVNDPP